MASALLKGDVVDPPQEKRQFQFEREQLFSFGNRSTAVNVLDYFQGTPDIVTNVKNY